MSNSRLGRHLDRQRLANGCGHGLATEPGQLLTPPSQPPQPVSLDKIVPHLMSMGIPIQYGVTTDTDGPHPHVRLVAVCGSLVIPICLFAHEARALAAKILEACESLAIEDPPSEPAADPTPD
jgi:hypothetical protein